MSILTLTLVLFSGSSTPVEAADPPPPGSRPNILFLFADDMRPDGAACAGSPYIKTPRIDRLASHSLVFTQAHIMGGLQGAVCVPSRAMMLSGRSLFQVDEQLRDVPTWPMQLREAGYVTHATGKWHNGAPAAAASFPSARSLFLGGMVQSQVSVPLVDMQPDGKPGTKRVEERHSSEVFADEAVRFLEGRKDATSPWALYVAFTAPHDPRDAPDAYRSLYQADSVPLPPNYLPEHPFDNGEMKIRDEQLETWPRTPEAIRRHLADYGAIISHLDNQVGRILDALDAIGQADNTVVVFAADNGLAIGSHGLMGKQNLYEHSMGVPLVVRGPGVPAAQRTDALCYILDLAPTFCEIAGTPAPAGSIGKSLIPVLKSPDTRHRDILLFAYRHLMRGVRDDRWKAIWYPPLKRWQLFDLQADPHEKQDLAADPAHAARLATLQQKLAELRVEFGDTAALEP